MQRLPETSARPARGRCFFRPAAGFTLVEIAVVLLVIGGLVVAVFKANELILNARVRKAITVHHQYHAAIAAFLDRYHYLPGDHPAATAEIQRVQFNGNGNGRVESAAVPAGPAGVPQEDQLAWEHLSKAEMIDGAYVLAPASPELTFPRNPWGGFLDFAVDTAYGDSAGTPSPRHTLKTGNQIPVEVVSEMDYKMDDGNAKAGSFQFSAHARAGTPPAMSGPGRCADATTGRWITNESVLAVNCGAASLL
jgi:type II secretory pathway pseudopilin PulG